eukprot:3745520-Rhodomonas_salina.4
MDRWMVVTVCCSELRRAMLSDAGAASQGAQSSGLDSVHCWRHHAAVSGWTVQTCAPTLCGGGVCEAAHTRGVAVWFEGYVASLDGLMEQSLVFIAPRLAGVSPGFNSCVAVVVAWAVDEADAGVRARASDRDDAARHNRIQHHRLGWKPRRVGGRAHRASPVRSCDGDARFH